MEIRPDIPNPMITCEEMVELLTQAHTSNEHVLHRHVYRETLRALVRLAKAEKILEIKRDVARATGGDRNFLSAPPSSET